MDIKYLCTIITGQPPALFYGNFDFFVIKMEWVRKKDLRKEVQKLT